MIEVQNLTKLYDGNTAIEDISFKIDGGVLGIIAPVGAGKSTLLNIMAGVCIPSSGGVLIDGNDVFEYPTEAKKATGYLMEGAPLYFDMTPYEYLIFIGEAKKVPCEKLYRQIDEVLELVGIENVRNILIANLSKSKRKKLGVAQTLLGNPDVVLLDEPFAKMSTRDASDIRSVVKMLGRIKTVIITSSSLGDISDICDKLMFLSEGKIAVYKNTDELEAEEIFNELFSVGKTDCDAEEEEQ